MVRPVELHRAILAIADAQRGERASPLARIVDDRGGTLHEQEREPSPVVGVVVDEERDRGIGGDVPHPLQGPSRAPLRLGVDDEVDAVADACVAERHDVRRAVGVGGREMGDAMARERGARRGVKDARHRPVRPPSPASRPAAAR
jgi:hypothetical protein